MVLVPPANHRCAVAGGLAVPASLVIRPRAMPSGPSNGRDSGGHRLGGARADFVASLGRKVQDARELVAGLEDDPSSRSARDDLRRKLHALGSGARLLRFDAMALALGEALAVLERGAKAGALRETDVVFVAQVIDDLPALAWSEAPPAEASTPGPTVDGGEGGNGVESSGEGTEGSKPAGERAPAAAMPIATLVVGGEDLADALTDDAAIRTRAFECERTEDARSALELARAHAPDLVLIDADLPHAAGLVEALLDDPLTEPVPIVVVGSFRAPDESARFVALGVARALPKPVLADLLRRSCDEILDAREGRTLRITLGEPTLEQLADRLAQELRRALVDSVDGPARSCRVPLGEGTEVLAALWGAIARVQEIVAQRTGGAIHFGGDAPEGAVALAPWLQKDVGAADRLGSRGRGAAADVRLDGRRVVVADDDPGVTWFISDLLRTAGCEVHEALDGAQALELAFRVQPELVVSDILMPGIDGFALCRALKRDVALRDTPVILLSWKEDLLQRVRELGANAAAYMRKESDSRAILARAREVLRPRARIEMRLRGEGEVRGRLDGLTARLLLELVGAIRSDARVTVRDASHLYEIEIRGGVPSKATRTAADGGYVRGERTLASLLGVGSGRFVISPSSGPVRGELSGSLSELLAKPIAAARGALAVTTGAGTMQVERIGIDDAALEEYLRATPDPARSLLKRVARGESPRQMLLAGEMPPSLFEDVVADLAARGAITLVQGSGGVDLLGPAVAAAAQCLRGAPLEARGVAPAPTRRAGPSGQAPGPQSPWTAVVAAEPSGFESLRLSEPPPSSTPMIEEGDAAPSSLEDAVMRELSDRSPGPAGARASTSSPPPIIEPSELRRRSSNPPAGAVLDARSDASVLASLPPDAMVPAASSSEEILASVASPELLEDLAADDGPTDAEPHHDTDVEGRYEALLAASTTEPLRLAPPLPFPRRTPPGRLEPTQPLPLAPQRPRSAEPAAPLLEALAEAALQPAAPSARVEARQAEPAAGSSRAWWGLLLVGGAVGVIAAVVLGTAHPATLAPVTPPARSTPTPTAPATPAVPEAPMPPAPAPPSASEGELPAGAEVPAGLGVLDVSAPPGARIRVDGAIAGLGPALSMVAAPGFHDLRVEMGGRQSKSVIEVRAFKTTHVDASAPP